MQLIPLSVLVGIMFGLKEKIMTNIANDVN